ncbi:MAG: monofunctional biosynthetic peptidoglycan transglycosylase [Bacteroidetes bacterium]|nr:monofunctional biosynthetic peptidoglycan transglycosylase [Bacteroidota bacterium]
MATVWFRHPLWKKFKRWTLRLVLAFIGISLFWVLLMKWVNPTTTPLMLSRKWSAAEGFEIQKSWVPIENISKNMQLAVICGEDQNFCQHHGFDFDAISKALENNAAGGPKRGASTISQQTAKNVFLWEGRSWLRKGLEVWFTGLIELIWGKKRIMEVYLNVIETGNGCFGVEAASKRYFKTHASKLGLMQSARIASILPCPRSCGLKSYFSNARTSVIQYCMTRYGIQLEYLQ